MSVLILILIIIVYAYITGLIEVKVNISEQTHDSNNAPSAIIQTPNLLPNYIESPDIVCGADYESQPGSSASLDCMRSMWLNAKCTDKGTVWQNSLDPKIPVDRAKEQVKWWSDRQKISDIESDMGLYYSFAAEGDQSYIASCGI